MRLRNGDLAVDNVDYAKFLSQNFKFLFPYPKVLMIDIFLVSFNFFKQFVKKSKRAVGARRLEKRS